MFHSFIKRTIWWSRFQRI